LAIIVFTANNEKSASEFLKIGANDFIQKPYTKIELKTRVNSTLELIDFFEEIQRKHQILKEYFDLISQVALIYKMDTERNITFANDIFCEISEYSSEELIGKSYDIVTHPQMSSDILKQMQEVIQDGKIWKGKLKNQSKNGSEYFVNETILPIYKDNNILDGYIGIGFLTTEEETKQREFKKQIIQQIKEFRLKENEYKQKIKDLEEKLKLSGIVDLFEGATDIEKERQKAKEANAQIKKLQEEIEIAKQKGFDMATKYKDELAKSLRTIKTLQNKENDMQLNMNILKTNLDNYKRKIKELTEINNKHQKRIAELEDVILHLKSPK